MEEKNSKIDFLIFPFLWLFKTQQGNRLMDRLAQYRIISFLSYFSLMLMPIFSIIAILVLLLTVSLYLSFSEVREIARDVGPQGALLIPGLNPYLPIVYGWIAIFIGIVIHELSHGVVARNIGVPVKSAGLMFFVLLPIGAFVEVDD